MRTHNDDLEVPEPRHEPSIDQPSILTSHRRRQIRGAVRPPLVAQLANRAKGRRRGRIGDLCDEANERSFGHLPVSAHRTRDVRMSASGGVSTGVHSQFPRARASLAKRPTHSVSPATAPTSPSAQPNNERFDLGRMGRDMGPRTTCHRTASAIWPSTWCFLAPPAGIEPAACGLGNESDGFGAVRQGSPYCALCRPDRRSTSATVRRDSHRFGEERYHSVTTNGFRTPCSAAVDQDPISSRSGSEGGPDSSSAAQTIARLAFCASRSVPISNSNGWSSSYRLISPQPPARCSHPWSCAS
jgi:hypothetical protein